MRNYPAYSEVSTLNAVMLTPDVWLRDAGEVWEYIVVYVDDIIVMMKDPKFF